MTQKVTLSIEGGCQCGALPYQIDDDLLCEGPPTSYVPFIEKFKAGVGCE